MEPMKGKKTYAAMGAAAVGSILIAIAEFLEAGEAANTAELFDGVKDALAPVVATLGFVGAIAFRWALGKMERAVEDWRAGSQ